MERRRRVAGRAERCISTNALLLFAASGMRVQDRAAKVPRRDYRASAVRAQKKGDGKEAPLTLPDVARLAEVEYRTLHTWLKRGLLQPSLQRSTGTGRPNLFSTRDAIAARVLADLRRVGAGFPALVEVARTLKAAEGTPENAVLVVNGQVTVLDDEQQLRQALSQPEPALIYRLAWAESAVREAGRRPLWGGD